MNFNNLVFFSSCFLFIAIVISIIYKSVWNCGSGSGCGLKYFLFRNILKWFLRSAYQNDMKILKNIFFIINKFKNLKKRGFNHLDLVATMKIKFNFKK